MKNRILFFACVLTFLFAVPATAGKQELKYLDAHIHFWDVNVHKGLKNWPGEQNKILYRTFLPEHYLPESRDLGIEQTVMLQSGRTVDEIRWAIDISEPHAEAFPGIVFNFNESIGTDRFDELYAEAKKSDRFVGVRVMGGTITPKNDQFEEVIAHLRMLAKDNMSLDILPFGCKMHDIAKLAEQVPGLRIMVNAKGKVGYHSLSPDGPSEEWIEDMRHLVAHTDVCIKLTGQTMPGTDDPHNPDYFKPYYDELLKLFGGKRLVWASNWPTLLNAEESLEMTVKHATQNFAALSDEEKQDIFFNNAARFYKISPKQAAGLEP